MSLILKNKFEMTGAIQIGANEGQEIDCFFNEAKASRVLAFEPLIECLQKIPLRDNLIKVNSAVGNSNGVVAINVSSNSGQSSSVLLPKTHLIEHPWVKFINKISVPIVKLDDWFEHNKIRSEDYNFMSIDVQGYELEVLRGAKNVLKNIQIILCEVNSKELYEDCPMVEDIDEYLSDYGFERTETSWFGNCGWGDALYIKNLGK